MITLEFAAGLAAGACLIGIANIIAFAVLIRAIQDLERRVYQATHPDSAAQPAPGAHVIIMSSADGRSLTPYEN